YIIVTSRVARTDVRAAQPQEHFCCGRLVDRFTLFEKYSCRCATPGHPLTANWRFAGASPSALPQPPTDCAGSGGPRTIGRHFAGGPDRCPGGAAARGVLS